MRKLPLIVIMLLILVMPAIGASSENYVSFINDEGETVIIPEGDGISIQFFTETGDYVGYTDTFSNEFSTITVNNSMGYEASDIASARVSSSSVIVSNTYTSMEWDGSTLDVKTTVYDQHSEEVYDFVEKMIGKDIYDFAVMVRDGELDSMKIDIVFFTVTLSNPLYLMGYFGYLIFFGGTMFTFIIFLILAFIVSYIVGFTKPDAFKIPIVSQAVFILGRVIKYRVLFHIMFIAGAVVSMYFGVMLASLAILLIVLYELKVLKGAYLMTRKVLPHKSFMLFFVAMLILWYDHYASPIPYAVVIAIVLALVGTMMLLWRVVHRTKKPNEREFTLNLKMDNTDSVKLRMPEEDGD